jgi:hypothetical protein
VQNEVSPQEVIQQISGSLGDVMVVVVGISGIQVIRGRP